MKAVKDLLAEAWNAGLVVLVAGGQLVVTGPRGAHHIVRELAARKAAILEAIAGAFEKEGEAAVATSFEKESAEDPAQAPSARDSPSPPAGGEAVVAAAFEQEAIATALEQEAITTALEQEAIAAPVPGQAPPAEAPTVPTLAEDPESWDPPTPYPHAGEPCPSCGRQTRGRADCWGAPGKTCCDRICWRCGKATGSAFIELCLLCEAQYNLRPRERNED